MSNFITTEEESKEFKEAEKLKRDRELNDIRTVLSNASGIRFLRRLMEKCGTFNTTFSPDAGTMAYLSGKQDVGHFLMSEITMADENLLLKLLKEKRSE